MSLTGPIQDEKALFLVGCVDAERQAKLARRAEASEPAAIAKSQQTSPSGRANSRI
jgi:hypothetical protein